MTEFDSTSRSATTRDFSVLSSDSLGEKSRPVSQVIALLNEMSTQLQTGARFSLLVKMPWNRRCTFNGVFLLLVVRLVLGPRCAPYTLGVWMKDLFVPRFGLLPLVAPNRLWWVMRVFWTVKFRCRREHPAVTEATFSFYREWSGFAGAW